MVVTMAMKRDHIKSKKVHCLNCKHLGITWNPTTPYFCRAWSIRSLRYPCEEVFSASGLQCQKFEQKPLSDNNPIGKRFQNNRREKMKNRFIKKI